MSFVDRGLSRKGHYWAKRDCPSSSSAREPVTSSATALNINKLVLFRAFTDNNKINCATSFPPSPPPRFVRRESVVQRGFLAEGACPGLALQNMENLSYFWITY